MHPDQLVALVAVVDTGSFEAAARSPELIVGVNIVGPENGIVAMRDYALHMRMFKFLRAKYPSVNVAMHAGELTLGDVPPEELGFHIQEALQVAGARRIGHGLDLAHERDALLARFAEARVRLDAVLQRLPADPSHDGATTPAPPAPPSPAAFAAVR